MRTFLIIAFFLYTSIASSQNKKALTGGTLIDGFGGEPIKNSVILIEGGKITKVGQVGTVTIPAGYEIISTEGMSVLPGLWLSLIHI